MAWLFPPLQTMVEYRATDTIIAVPAKSGTTWSMNIFHQLRTGGDPDFADVYREVPWVEFKERPDQSNEELLERWKQMPYEIPRAFKTHASPTTFCEYNPNLKYLVVMRNPEEAIVSFKPFLEQHTDEIWQVWDAEAMKPEMVRPDLSFEDWFFDVALKWEPPGPPDAPKHPHGMMNVFFTDFINGWWPHRNKPNVLFMHFSDMKRDHEGSVRKIADFLGMKPTPEQWPKILEYTSFKWMKEHEEKFEGLPGTPVPLLKRGAMIRKGAAGKAAEDGLTSRVSQRIKDILEETVPDEEARKWFMTGGPVPGAVVRKPSTYSATSVTHAAPVGTYVAGRSITYSAGPSATIVPSSGSVTYAAAQPVTIMQGSASLPAAGVTTYAAPSVTYAAPVAPAQTVYTISPERFKLIMQGQPLTQEEIQQMTGGSSQIPPAAEAAVTPTLSLPAEAVGKAVAKVDDSTSKKESKKKSSKKKLSSKKKSKGCC